MDSSPDRGSGRIGTGRIRLLSTDFDDSTMDEVLELREGRIITVHTDMLAKFEKNPLFAANVAQFDVVTCDSQILVFAAKLLGTPFRERISGSDYFPRFYRRYADDESVTIFLCGALPGVAEVAADKINTTVGRTMVVGTYSPKRGWFDDPDEVRTMIAAINDSGATVLLLGLPAGNQEDFIIRHGHRMPAVKLFLPLGGTIDYEAGALRRPPPFVTNLGLEWVWRLVLEPRRRWYRYLIAQPPVLWLLFKQRIGRYRGPAVTDRSAMEGVVELDDADNHRG